MDIYVVVMSPSKTYPAAVYGPFESKHAAWLFIEDRLNEYEPREPDRRCYVVRGYGTPINPVHVQ
jgi:hypothetical protein